MCQLLTSCFIMHPKPLCISGQNHALQVNRTPTCTLKVTDLLKERNSNFSLEFKLEASLVIKNSHNQQQQKIEEKHLHFDAYTVKLEFYTFGLCIKVCESKSIFMESYILSINISGRA